MYIVCVLCFRVVAIDTRGYGGSGKPNGLEHYALDNLVEDIPAVIKALGVSLPHHPTSHCQYLRLVGHM